MMVWGKQRIGMIARIMTGSKLIMKRSQAATLSAVGALRLRIGIR